LVVVSGRWGHLSDDRHDLQDRIGQFAVAVYGDASLGVGGPYPGVHNRQRRDGGWSPDRARSHPLLKSAISVRRLFQRGRQLCASDGGGSALGVEEQNCALGSESQCVTCLIVPY